MLDALTALVAAQRGIDDWDHELTAPPTEDYSAAEVAIDALPKDSIVAFLSHTNPAVRREAAKTCRRWRYLPAHDALVAALGDDDQETRDEVTDALVATARETALATIASSGATIGKAPLARAADAAFEAFGTDILPLLEALEIAPDNVVRERDVWWKIHALDPAKAGEVLERAVLTGRWDWVYGAAELVMAQGGGPWIRPTYEKLLHHDQVNVQMVATKLLGSFGDDQTIESLLSSIATLRHPGHRASAIRSAFALAGRSQLPILERVLLHAGPSDTEAILTALASGPTWESREVALEFVRRQLTEEGPQVTLAIRAATALRLDLISEIAATLRHENWYAKDMCDAREAYAQAMPHARSMLRA